MIALQKTTDVFTVSSPIYCFQAKIETRNGLRDANKVVYKPTKSVTNSKVLAEALYRRCSNISGPPFHRHIVLNGGIAKMASAYAPERMMVGSLSWSCSLQVLHRENWSSTSRVMQPISGRMNFGDHTGAQLPGELVRKGKMEEIRWVKEIGLYKKISRAEAKRMGIAIVPIRWVVKDKGDPNRPKVRCRLVGRELRAKTKGTLLAYKLFSAMPLWESFKVLLGLLVCDNVPGAEGEELEMAIFDISRAYFMAPMDREACIELPQDDKLPEDGDAVSLLLRSMYGVSYSKCKLDERQASNA